MRVLVFFLLSELNFVIAADTLSYKNKLQCGLKLITEKSGLHSLVPLTKVVNSVGIQIIKPVYKSTWQFESGLFAYSRAISYSHLSDKKFILFRYLSIPLNCQISSKYLFVSTGLSVDYLIKQNLNNWLNKNQYILSKFSLGYNLNVGVQKSINQFNIYLEARFNRLLTSLYQSNLAFDPSFRNIGLGIGVNYSLGK